MKESQQDMHPVIYGREIDLRELFGILWAGKSLIAGVTLISAISAIIVSLMLPDIYRAEALLAPNNQEGASGLSALAAQYGDLASMAGVNLGAASSDQTALGLEILKSRKFISEFIERHNILVPLIAAKDFDRVTGELIIDSGQYDVSAEQWVREKGRPSLQEAYRHFMRNLSVSQDVSTGFVVVAIEHRSPEIARQWVAWLIDDLNSSIMYRDVAEAEQAIEFLNAQIEQTSLSELQNVFFGLIEQQTKTVMLAKVTDEYLLKTLDPAIAPEQRSKPKRTLIVILTTFVGFTLGVIIVLVLRAMRNEINA